MSTAARHRLREGRCEPSESGKRVADNNSALGWRSLVFQLLIADNFGSDFVTRGEGLSTNSSTTLS